MNKKSNLFRKIIRLSKLRQNEIVTIIFDEKIQMFKKDFFLLYKRECK